MHLSSVKTSDSMKFSLWTINHVLSSVALILINKVIMGPPFNFKYVFTLSSIHLFVTAVTMEFMALNKVFVPSSGLKWSASLMLTSIVCGLSAGLMNLSLRMNSLDFYELFKLLGVPWLVFMQVVVYKKHTSCMIIITLFMILIGIVLAATMYAQSNLFSCVVALVAVLVTTQSQIWENQKEHEDQSDLIQIAHAQVLPSFFACALLAILLEFTSFNEEMNILYHTWTLTEIKWILLSAAAAAFVNLCSYGLMEDTSIIAFEAAKHLKTVLILIASYYLYDADTHKAWNNLLGIAIALCGTVSYTYLSSIEAPGRSLDEWFSAIALNKLFRSPVDHPNEMKNLLLDSTKIQISPIY